jgi:hypothetical protein
MRRIAGGAAALVVGLAFVATGAARPHALVPLKVGDTLDVVGTQIACQAAISKVFAPGKSALVCLKVDAKGPKIGSYAVALAADGTAGAYVVPKSRQPKLVFRRTAGLAAHTTYVKANAGDSVLLRGTDIACSVRKTASGGVYIACFKIGPKGKPSANSYAILISDALSAVLRLDAAGNSHQVFGHANP